MGASFGVFFREHILTWNHLQSPFSFVVRGEAKEIDPYHQVASEFIAAGVATGASYLLESSRTNILLIAGGTALTTFYAVTGYFKWCLMQPPVYRRPVQENSDKRGQERDKTNAKDSSSSRPVRQQGFTSPGSSHKFEDFRNKPDWLVPQRTSNSSFLGAAANLRQEKERAYFASLWKSMYEGTIAHGEHWMNYSEQNDLLKNNKLSVIEGAPWEEFARFAQKYMQ